MHITRKDDDVNAIKGHPYLTDGVETFSGRSLGKIFKEKVNLVSSKIKFSKSPYEYNSWAKYVSDSDSHIMQQVPTEIIGHTIWYLGSCSMRRRFHEIQNNKSEVAYNLNFCLGRVYFGFLKFLFQAL